MSFQIDRKKITKNIITLYIRQIITMLISFFTVRITLEQLGVVDYGLNNLIGSIVSIFSFINGSMGTSVQRFFSYEIGRGNDERLKCVFGTGLYIHLVVTIITLFLCEIFAVFFLQKMNIPPERGFAAQIVFQISLLSMCLGIITVPYTALLRAREMFSQMALVDIFQVLLRLGILYLLIISNYDKLILLSVLNLLVSSLGFVILVLMSRKFTETHTKILRDKGIINELLKFTGILLMTVLASLLNTYGIVMLINLFFGLAINAAYAIAMQIQNVVNTFVNNLKFAVVPQIMSAYGAGDLKSMHDLITFGTKVTFLLLLIITLPIIFCSEWILTIWLGKLPEYTSSLVVLSLISLNIGSFTYFHYQGVHASGCITNHQIWISISYVLAAITTYILFKLGMSVYWAMIINIFLGVGQCCINLYYSKKNYDYPVIFFVKNILPKIICVLCISIIVSMVLKCWVFYELLYCILICIFVPFLSFFLLFTATERDKILGFIESKFIEKWFGFKK